MEALAGLLSFVSLLLILALMLTFIPRAQLTIERRIPAPYRIPLRRFRGMAGIAAVAALITIGIVAPESPEKHSSPAAVATTTATPVALVTPVPAVAESAPPEPATRQGQETAYQFALLQDPTNPRVAYFQKVLNGLSRSYGETPQQIANETVKAQESLAAKGLQESFDDMAEAMQEISTAKAGIAYKDALALYIALREKGAGPGA